MTCSKCSIQIQVGTGTCPHHGALVAINQRVTEATAQHSRVAISAHAVMVSPDSLLLTEDVTGTALQPVDDRLQLRQGDALLTLLKAKQRGRRQPNLLREGFKGHLPTLFTQEGGEGLIQGSHPQEIKHIPFRIWNVYLEATGSLIDGDETSSLPS